MQQKSQRRQYLHRIVAATTFLGKQGSPFLGHDEQESSQNQGNFIECMKLIKQFDPFLQEYTPSSHTTYLSHFSQNEITSISQEITERIIKQMKIAKMYSVMADEARDRCTEQLAVCVRFVTQKGVVRECFLGLRKLQGFDAKSIADEIEAMLQSHNLGDLLCVAQAYDGASVMSGAVGGVQARFRERHPEAIPEATAFFELLEDVYTFFRNSLVNHNKFIEIQKQLGLRPSELVQLSAVLPTLTELRTDSGGEDVFRRAMALCEANDIQLPVGPLLVESACGSTSNLTSTFFYPCLDKMVEELTHRFSGLGEALMSGIHACNPTSETFLSEEALKRLASHYKIQLKPEELLVAKSFINRRMEKESLTPPLCWMFNKYYE